jgi:hypothetical protein
MEPGHMPQCGLPADGWLAHSNVFQPTKVVLRGALDRDPLGRRNRFGCYESIAAPVVGGVITSTIHVLFLVPVFFI